MRRLAMGSILQSVWVLGMALDSLHLETCQLEDLETVIIQFKTACTSELYCAQSISIVH